jgi:hypothetical protein
MNDELEGTWKEAGIYLKGLEKGTENLSQNNRRDVRDFNRALPVYISKA